jgi:D-alanyl-D-alanine carboxypeptidase (penicillin-binding protein 5/6)
MIIRNKYTGKINWLPILSILVGAVFVVVLLTVILSEVFRDDTAIQGNATVESTDESSVIAQPITDISYSEAEDGSVLIDNYPAYAESETKLTENNIYSKYAVLLDVSNNEILADRDCEEQIYPASMTKLMSLLVAVENIKDFNDTYTITYDLISPLIEQEAARAGFSSGETVSITDLLYGMILPSGADATMGIVDYVSSSEEEFVALMNQKAKALGMNHTHFANATGLHDEDHYSTVLDIAILMKAVMENPTCRQILGTVEYRTTPTEQHPSGMILLSTMYKRMYGNEVKNMTIIGGKTGFTDQAMQCLASYATAVDGNEYVVVTAYAATEMNPVFDAFAMYGLVNGGYEMPTQLEKTTYPATEATTTTEEGEETETTETEESDADAEKETDPEEESLSDETTDAYE